MKKVFLPLALLLSNVVLAEDAIQTVKEESVDVVARLQSVVASEEITESDEDLADLYKKVLSGEATEAELARLRKSPTYSSLLVAAASVNAIAHDLNKESIKDELKAVEESKAFAEFRAAVESEKTENNN